jgi:hypothetical protein
MKEIIGRENKNSNVDNFLSDLHKNPSSFLKSLGLYQIKNKINLNITNGLEIVHNHFQYYLWSCSNITL